MTTNDSRIRVYNGYQLQCKYKGLRNSRLQIKATYSEDGNFIICGSEDKCTYMWSTTNSYVPFFNPLGKRYQRDRNSSYEGFKASDEIVTVAAFAPRQQRWWCYYCCFLSIHFASSLPAPCPRLPMLPSTIDSAPFFVAFVFAATPSLSYRLAWSSGSRASSAQVSPISASPFSRGDSFFSGNVPNHLQQPSSRVRVCGSSGSGLP